MFDKKPLGNIAVLAEASLVAALEKTGKATAKLSLCEAKNGDVYYIAILQETNGVQ